MSQVQDQEDSITMDLSDHSTSSSSSSSSSCSSSGSMSLLGESMLGDDVDGIDDPLVVVPSSTKSIDSVHCHRSRRRRRSSKIRHQVGSVTTTDVKAFAFEDCCSSQGGAKIGRKQVHWGDEPSSIEYYQYSQDSPPVDSAELRTLKWYVRSDIQSFKEERKQAAKFAATHGVPAVEASGRATCRGLEHMTSRRMSNEREQRQRVATQVVLDGCSYLPPARRRLSMDHKEQLIAIQYQSVTKHCQLVAHERARAYWKETQDVFREDHGEDYVAWLLQQVSASSCSSPKKEDNFCSTSLPTTPKSLYNRRRFLSPGGSAGSRHRRRRGGIGATANAPHSTGSVRGKKRGLRGFFKALPIA